MGIGICPHCGAKMKEYNHVLSIPLCKALVKLYNHSLQGEIPVNIKCLKMTRNQWDNFQKLRYWDLVSKYVDQNGKRKGGEWKITKRGIDFVKGIIRIKNHVTTYRGERIKYYGSKVRIESVVEDNYRKRRDYAKDSTPHKKGTGL